MAKRGGQFRKGKQLPWESVALIELAGRLDTPLTQLVLEYCKRSPVQSESASLDASAASPASALPSQPPAVKKGRYKPGAHRSKYNAGPSPVTASSSSSSDEPQWTLVPSSVALPSGEEEEYYLTVQFRSASVMSAALGHLSTENEHPLLKGRLLSCREFGAQPPAALYARRYKGHNFSRAQLEGFLAAQGSLPSASSSSSSSSSSSTTTSAASAASSSPSSSSPPSSSAPSASPSSASLSAAVSAASAASPTSCSSPSKEEEKDPESNAGDGAQGGGGGRDEKQEKTEADEAGERTLPAASAGVASPTPSKKPPAPTKRERKKQQKKDGRASSASSSVSSASASQSNDLNASVKGLCCCPEEALLLPALLSYLPPSPYFVGYVRGDKATAEHERRHAHFSLDPLFAEAVRSVWDKAAARPIAWRAKFGKWLLDVGYHPDVYAEEWQAYVLSDWETVVVPALRRSLNAAEWRELLEAKEVLEGLAHEARLRRRETAAARRQKEMAEEKQRQDEKDGEGKEDGNFAEAGRVEGTMAIPTRQFTMNLDLPPRERWRAVLLAPTDAAAPTSSPPLASHFASVMEYVDQEAREEFGGRLIGPLVVSAIGKLLTKLMERRLAGTDYWEELLGIAEVGAPYGLTLQRAVLVQLGYDILARCTSAVVQTAWSEAGSEGGVPVLLRNMDWASEPLRKLVADVTFVRKGQPVFRAVTWLGFVGVLTGQRIRNKEGEGYAAAVNYRHCNGWLLANLRAILRGSVPVGFALRHSFEHAEDYTAALSYLSTVPLSAPVYFIVAGAKAGQGCILTRDRDASINPFHLPSSTPSASHHSPVPEDKKQEAHCIVQTNIDHFWRGLSSSVTPASSPSMPPSSISFPSSTSLSSSSTPSPPLSPPSSAASPSSFLAADIADWAGTDPLLLTALTRRAVFLAALALCLREREKKRVSEPAKGNRAEDDGNEKGSGLEQEGKGEAGARERRHEDSPCIDGTSAPLKTTDWLFPLSVTPVCNVQTNFSVIMTPGTDSFVSYTVVDPRALAAQAATIVASSSSSSSPTTSSSSLPLIPMHPWAGDEICRADAQRARQLRKEKAMRNRKRALAVLAAAMGMAAAAWKWYGR